MTNPSVLDLLARLRAQEGAALPASALGRLGRTAAIAARTARSAVAARLRGGELALGGLDAEAVARLAESLGAMKGVAMKVGQILSYVDASLGPEARALLSVLQVYAQPTPYAEIEATLRADLGERAAQVLATLERAPLAVASIGQVHRAVRPDGTPMAVKVRHRGIEVAIRADFRSAAVGKALAAAIVPGANVGAVVAEAERRFLEECDYALEAERQARFAALYAAHDSLSVPAVYPPWCGARVLATELASGLGLEDFRRASAPARARAARAMYEFYVGTLYRHGLFNADPHPGNLLFDDEGGVTVLDHGCVRQFAASEVEALRRLSPAVRADDGAAVRAALYELGMPEPGAHYEATRALLRGFYAPLLVAGPRVIPADRAVGLGELTRLKHEVLRMRLPGELLFLFRIRFGLYAVLARLGAEVDWAALEEELLAP